MDSWLGRNEDKADVYIQPDSNTTHRLVSTEMEEKGNHYVQLQC